jgi:hypothetical protein
MEGGRFFVFRQAASFEMCEGRAECRFARAAVVAMCMTQMAAQPAECGNSCVRAPKCADYDPAPLGVLRLVAAGSAKQRLKLRGRVNLTSPRVPRNNVHVFVGFALRVHIDRAIRTHAQSINVCRLDWLWLVRFGGAAGWQG